jgi:hypothetical protein
MLFILTTNNAIYFSKNISPEKPNKNNMQVESLCERAPKIITG